MPIHTVESPLPGAFYRASAPGQPPFKEEGDRVEAGETVGLIEVMKQFSEVTADVAGKLIKFHVENEGAVEPGMPLFDIETD